MKVRSQYLLVMVVAWGPCLLVAAASYALVLRPQQAFRRELEAKVASYKQQYARALQAAKEKNQGVLAGEVEGLHDRVRDFVVGVQEAPSLSFQIG